MFNTQRSSTTIVCPLAGCNAPVDKYIHQEEDMEEPLPPPPKKLKGAALVSYKKKQVEAAARQSSSPPLLQEVTITKVPLPSSQSSTRTSTSTSTADIEDDLIITNQAIDDEIIKCEQMLSERIHDDDDTFPKMLHKMLQEAEEKGFGHLVKRLPLEDNNGLGFVVEDPYHFMDQLGGGYFKMSKWESFCKQCWRYGFRKYKMEEAQSNNEQQQQLTDLKKNPPCKFVHPMLHNPKAYKKIRLRADTDDP